MKRAIAPLVLAAPMLLAATVLAGCDYFGGKPDARQSGVPKEVAANPVIPATESEYGTPVKDRVATLGLLNKRNNVSQDLVMKTGESRQIGNLIVKLASCERTLPWESPAETGAFVQLFVQDRNKADEPLVWRQVFSGWLFKTSPSLNVVEHPVYDVWVKDCAMKFPGEEEEAPAAASSPANASPSASAAPSPSPSPSASARPSPTPSPSPPRAPAAKAAPDE